MKYLTADEVEAGYTSLAARVNEVKYSSRLRELCIAACQRLADSPCPVCQVQNKNPDINPPGSVYTTSGFKDCPNCGGFPLDRWGKAFATKEAAIDSLSNQPKEDGA